MDTSTDQSLKPAFYVCSACGRGEPPPPKTAVHAALDALAAELPDYLRHKPSFGLPADLAKYYDR